jgi:hypothetical protein
LFIGKSCLVESSLEAEDLYLTSISWYLFFIAFLALKLLNEKRRTCMRQLSIIYLVIGSVLLVGVLLISISPDQQLILAAPQNLEENTPQPSTHLPLYFFPHQARVKENPVYYARTSQYTMWTTSEGLRFDQEGGEGVDEEKISRLVFLNANRNPGIIPLEITQHQGNETARAILYRDLYDRIDLKICGDENQIDYTWIVRPGGNPGDIRFEYRNVKAAGIDNQWNLAIETSSGDLIQQKTASYQMIAGEKHTIYSHFDPIAQNLYGFKIKAFDRDHDLFINLWDMWDMWNGQR